MKMPECCEDDMYCKKLPKVELHAHLNGSISPATLASLVRLHREKFPGEELPATTDLVISGDSGGEYGTNKDPFLIFPVIHAITDNLDAVRIVTRDVIRDFAEDGVRYLELRTTPREVEGRMSRQQYCETVLEEMMTVSGTGLGITVKLLLSIDRKNLDGMDDIVSLYKELRSKPRYASLVVGLDISGDPRVGDLRSVLGELTRLRAQDGVPMSIHLAEIVSHAETAAVLDTCHVGRVRLGHATCIAPSLGGSEALLEQLTRVRPRVAVEACLSSNVVCHTVPEYSQHQAGIYHKLGVPVVLCTDDKGVFSCSLSGELGVAARTWGWSRHALWQLQRAALDHAFVAEAEREELRAAWDTWRRGNTQYFGEDDGAVAAVVLTEEQKVLLEKQNSRLITEFKANKLEAEAQKNWDLFYKRNETKFFKDRHWTTREFQELLGTDISEGGSDGDRKVLLEVGCGVGNLAFPLLEEKLPLYFYCCDFSPRAVQFVKDNPLYHEDKIKAFHCDLTTGSLLEQLGPGSVDIVTCIFVLSAIHPDNHRAVFASLSAVLRPGGCLLFRDYGLYDMAMLRFKAGSKISEQFYVRQDGTRSYFFTEEEVRQLGEGAGLQLYQHHTLERRTLNLKEGVDVPRHFVQSKFRKL